MHSAARTSPVASAALAVGVVALVAVLANGWLDVRRERGQRDARVADLLDEASDLLGPLGPDEETSYERRVILGAALSELDRHALAQARRRVERALEIDPENAAALSFQAFVSGRAAPAAVSGAIPARFASVYYQLGSAYLRVQRLDEAVASYRRATQINPSFVNAHVGLGHALLAKGQLDDASACYWKALRLDPDAAPAHHGLALTLHRRGKQEAALAEYRKAVELDPEDPVLLDDLGDLLFETGEMEAAAEHFRRASALAPHFAAPHRGLAGVLAALGRVEEAAASLAQARRLEPAPAMAAAGP